MLGFVVAGREAGQQCTPTWGTYHTLDEAAVALDLDRRVAQLRGQGGDAIISFGGQANKELAVVCDDAAALKQAYAETIDRYDADTIDFDIEGDALRATAATTRRAAAVKAIQDEIRADGDTLAVWLTLPVTPDGLQDDALAVVRAMLEARVDLAGVNIMAMDFGWKSASKDMRDAILSSIKATRGQLAAVFPQEGLSLSTRNVWRKLGVTIMIGQNDVAGERVSVDDAEAVAQYALDHGLGRAGTWSLNRDQQCGATFAVIGEHSNVCSGVRQKPLAFTRAFGRLRGSARSSAASVTTRDLLPEAGTDSTDDPARSPYPIWQPEQAYREGYKVVWHRAVYIAKWFTQGQTPDAQNVPAGQNPWRLVGPVLKTDRAPRIPTLPAGTHLEVERRLGLHGRRQGALQRPPVRRPVVHAGRRPRRARPERVALAVEAALPHPGRAGADGISHTGIRSGFRLRYGVSATGRSPHSQPDRSRIDAAPSPRRLVSALAALSLPAASRRPAPDAVADRPYTLRPNPVIAITSTRYQVTCAGMSITASFDAAGNGTAPAGAASFTRCSTPLLGQ